MTPRCRGARQPLWHRCALRGLAATGKLVEVVTDAIQSLDEAACRRTLEEFTAGGGRLTTVAEVCLDSPDRPLVVT